MRVEEGGACCCGAMGGLSEGGCGLARVCDKRRRRGDASRGAVAASYQSSFVQSQHETRGASCIQLNAWPLPARCRNPPPPPGECVASAGCQRRLRAAAARGVAITYTLDSPQGRTPCDIHRILAFQSLRLKFSSGLAFLNAGPAPAARLRARGPRRRRVAGTGRWSTHG